AAGSCLPRQSVRRRWLRGVGGILLSPRQLPLQIRDPLLGVSDLLIALGYLTPEILKLSQQPLIFMLQLLAAGLVGAPRAIRRCALLLCPPSRSRTHPPYVKRFCEVCPGKSPDVRELLRRIFCHCERRRC